jgi:hypothetical protein
MLRELRSITTTAGLLLALAWPAILLGGLFQVSGSMVAVTKQAIWVREANGVVVYARLPEQAELSAGALVARFKLGDQVRVRAAEVSPKKGELPHRELRDLTYLRAPTAAELAAALRSRARRVADNVLPLPAGEAAAPAAIPAPPPAPSTPEAALLERAREVSQRYLAALPNFTVDAIQTSYVSEAVGEQGWREVGTLQSEISFQGTVPVYRDTERTGVMTRSEPATTPRAFTPNGYLKGVFDADCDVTIKFAGRAVESGTPVLVYRFASPADGCYWPEAGEWNEQFFAAHSGSLFIGKDDGVVRRLDVKAGDMASELNCMADELRGTWDFVKIAGERHLVPTSVDHVTWDARRSKLFRNSAMYQNYRHFSVSSTVDFK